MTLSIRKQSTSGRKITFFGGRNFPFHTSEKNVDSSFNVEEIICPHCWLIWKQICCEKDKESQNSWGWKWKGPLEDVTLSNLLAQAGLLRAGCSAQCPDEYHTCRSLQNLPEELVPKSVPLSVPDVQKEAPLFPFVLTASNPQSHKQSCHNRREYNYYFFL